VRVAYLGPAGTYTHEAMLASAPDGVELQELPQATIHEAVLAVQDGEAQRAIVPIENSVEGSVNATLDALAFDASAVRIVGETVLAVHHCLIARSAIAPGDVEVLLSHPQALAQCAAFVRERLAGAQVRAAASTAEAVRTVAGHDGPWAALGPRTAARRYGARVLLAGVEDVAGNETRFAWLARDDAIENAPARAPSGAPARPAPRFKTAIAFWPKESDHPGWLVDCLAEFARRGVNMTRIESRPRKVGLGEYVFFIDLAGAVTDQHVNGGLEGVRAHVAQLRVLGSFPAA
jgi:prephenate dehydratase